MNKKLIRTGPKVRVTRPSVQLQSKVRSKFEDSPIPSLSLLNHQRDCTYVYHCQYCGLKFTQNSHFFRHMTTHHDTQQKQATFECNDCQIVFTKKASLDLHYQTHHQTKSKSKCESCAITFKSRYCLRRHLKLKQVLQENSCIKCQKKFTTKEFLAKHVRNKHTFKNSTYQCDLCTLKFRVKESLQSHLNRIHKKL